MKEKFGNLKFDNITILRYSHVKGSIESLMGIIDTQNIEKYGSDVVLAEILKLIEENNNKAIEERRNSIKDNIYKKEILNNCFSNENKEKAIEILSKTNFLNPEEKFIYTINFYMPDDKEFIKLYTQGKKSSGDTFSDVSKFYKLENNQINRRLFQGRVMEVATFYQQYKEEKDKRKLSIENEVISAMQKAQENTNKENVNSVKVLMEQLPMSDVKTSLEEQLRELENKLNSNAQITEEKPEKNASEVSDNMNEDSYVEDNGKSEEIEIEVPVEEIIINRDNNNVSQEEQTVEVIIEEPETSQEKVTINNINDSAENNIKVQTKENTNDVNDPNLGQEVISAIQKIVVDSKESKAWVKDLEIKLENKDRKIAELERKIEAQNIELNNNTALIQEKVSEISQLKQKAQEVNQKLDNADRIISSNKATIDGLNKQINTLNSTLESYKNSLNEIKKYLADAQQS